VLTLPTSVRVFLAAGATDMRRSFDGSGLWVFAKRLEKGTFSWPEEGGAARVEMRAGELALLVGGIDLSRTRRRRWYDRKPA